MMQNKIISSYLILSYQGRDEEAIDELRRIARWNKKQLPENLALDTHYTSNNAHTNNNTTEKKEAVWSKDLLLKTFVQSGIWFVVTMSIFGLQMAAKELQGSMYSNFILLSLVSFPAITITVVATNKFGRKRTAVVALFCESIACLSIAFIPARKEFAIARVVMGIAGKFFASITLQSLYVWSAEIFPTQVRSKGMGVVEIMARFGAACSPWVIKGLTPVGAYLPFVVMGVPAFFGAVAGLWLPETRTVTDIGNSVV